MKVTNYSRPPIFPGTWHATGADKRVKEYVGKTELELIHRIYERDFRNFGYGWSPEVI